MSSFPREILVVATLTVRPGQLSRFEEYERQALAIASRHGGSLERAIRSSCPEHGGHVEVHILRFASEATFDAFRTDPELAALSQLRESAISKTEIMTGVAGPPYAT